jgi:hypothetical protein
MAKLMLMKEGAEVMVMVMMRRRRRRRRRTKHAQRST